MNGSAIKPNWDLLYETASAQDGYFTTRQAAETGYSSQLLLKHLRAGRAIRIRRGIYRLVHFPAGEHEELVVAWLWSEMKGVLSHQTALSLHGLSDVLPSHIDLTLPLEWQRRRFRIPEGVVLHYSDVSSEECTWYGAVPTTNPRRTLKDCAHGALSPDLLRQAAMQALRRGLVKKEEVSDVQEALGGFGGLEL